MSGEAYDSLSLNGVHRLEGRYVVPRFGVQKVAVAHEARESGCHASDEGVGRGVG